MTTSTAILLFSRTESHAEARGRGGRRVVAELRRQLRRKAARTGLEVIEVTEHEQVGETFGDRLSHATAGAFARGYDRLIIVGHDCPSLQALHLRAVARLLERGNNVLGPDRRGGSWLIGLQRADFDGDAFASLPWQTAELFAELTRFLPGAETLSTQSDLNTIAEIRRHAVRLRKFLGVIFALIDVVAPSGSRPVAARGVQLAAATPRRGPPPTA